MTHCKRCGQCCEKVALAWTPKEILKSYLNWFNDVKDAPKPQDIYLIAPMLRPLYYDKKNKRWRYRCIHLEKKGGKFSCAIYKMRPRMCSTYGVCEKKLEMGQIVPKNKTLYPGCVF